MVQQFSLLPFNLSKIEIFYVISAHNAGHDCCPVCADLLTKDYTYDHKLVISTTTQSGLVRGTAIQTPQLSWEQMAQLNWERKQNVDICCGLFLNSS
jgi:hypothetical protein